MTIEMELMASSIKEQLWHRMRQDLQTYVPQVAENDLLMCCACGRFLPYEDFSLEHIIPRRALAEDPKELKSDPRTSVNARSGNILLCRKPLSVKGHRVYGNGCNSWKGRFYDGRIRELLSGKLLDASSKKASNQHIIAALCSAYIAMVREFGYSCVLTSSGSLMRQQFFLPARFHPKMPVRCQMMLTGSAPKYVNDQVDIWLEPFGFTIDDNSCYVRFRNFVLILPLSRDPRIPVASPRLFTPPKYKLRPDFQTLFD
jgi:hypothetical protein